MHLPALLGVASHTFFDTKRFRARKRSRNLTLQEKNLVSA
jgi:hypothetical protein